MSTITYTNDQLKDIENLVRRLVNKGFYDLDDGSVRGLISVLSSVRSMVYMSGHQCHFFHDNFKKEVEHYSLIQGSGNGPCFWVDLYEILFVAQYRELPLKIHHQLQPLVKWRLENNI